jgi:hypothetical protein
MQRMLAPIAGCFLATLLLGSAWTKFRNRDTFHDIVRSYPFARLVNARLVVWLVPWMETALGLALFSLNRQLAEPALAGTLGFLALATAAVAGRWLRGEKRFRCGCGDDLRDEESVLGMLVRNGVLIAVAAGGLIGADKTSSQSVAVVPVVLSGVGLALGWKLIQAGQRAGRFAREWKGPGLSRTSPSGA